MATIFTLAGIVIALAAITIVLMHSRNRQKQLKPEPQPMPEKIEGSFPGNYEKDHVVVLVRDPEWLFAYWETTATKQYEFSQEYGDLWQRSTPTLRVYDVTDNPQGDFFDITVDDFTNNWYIHVGKPNHTFFVDLGRILPDGRFYYIARSNTVTTPSNSFSDEIDPNWMPIGALWSSFKPDYKEGLSTHDIFSWRRD